MKNQTYELQLALAAIALSLASHSQAQQAIEPEQPIDPAYAQKIRYENYQAFNGGPADFKDNNIWVYTSTFAETFGMPKAGIDALVGAEAIAFRLEDSGYQLCGMGGKAENCMKNTRYVMDVYIDERKHPLPWADPTQMADWLGEYNSTQWLRTGTSFLNERSGRISPSPLGVANSTLFRGKRTLRPFANANTHREVFWMDNASTDRDLLSDYGWNHISIFGYKRNAIAGLTLISFENSPTISGRNREVHFRLVERLEVMSRTLHQFHEIIIPTSFVEARAQKVKKQQELDQQFYRTLFRPLLGSSPNAGHLPTPSK